MSTSILFQNKQHANDLYLRFIERTQESVETDIDTIVKWLQTQTHLPEIPTRFVIANFLKMNKCSIEKTKTHIDMYYTIRHLLPEVYVDSHPRHPSMQEIAEKCYHITLPKLTKEGNVVTIIKILKPYISKDYMRSLTYMMNTTEIRLCEEISVRDIIVFDCENHTMSQIMNMTPNFLKTITILYKHVLSTRLYKIVLVNSPVPEVLINILKKFLSKKLSERIVALDNFEDLFEYVSKDMLPRDYGGEEMSMKELNEVWKAKLIEYYPRFDQLATMRVKEELRPNPLNNDEILGYYGNFKKLDVD